MHIYKLHNISLYAVENMMKKTVYDILIAEEYRDKSGAEKVQYHRAGVAFENTRGGVNCEITPGMALTGRFVIFPRDPSPRGSAKETPHDNARDARKD